MRGRSSILVGFTVTAVAALLAGSAAAASSDRVVGGSPTTTSQYPWMAGLVIDPAKQSGNALDRFTCGGVLITPYIALTAAHCLASGDPDPIEGLLDPPIDPDDINVVLGRTTLTSTAGAEVDVRDVAVQANYNETSGENDVGYVVLATGSGQLPIKLAGPAEAGLWSPGSPTQASGWGVTDEGSSSPSNTLRVATVPIIADSTCGSPSVYGSRFIAAVMVCAGYLSGGVDTCYGDSGSPLQAPVGGGGYRLVGITNWGDGCARRNAPGVYARVAGDSLRPAIAAKVFELESANGLPHQGLIGTPAPAAPPAASHAGLSAAAKRAVKRCKRIKKKRKRARCIRRAKRRLA